MSGSQRGAYLAFLLVTLFWGITFPLIRIGVQGLTPVQFVMLRFGLAFLFIAPFMLKRLFDPKSIGVRDLVLRGLGLGTIIWVSYQSQTIGLQTVEAGRAAFITGTSVVMIPLMSPLFGLGKPGRIDLMAAVGALIGLFLLTDPSGQNVSSGDLWVVLCAVVYAVYVHTLQKWIKKDADAILVSGFQILGVFLCSSLMSLTSEEALPALSLSEIAAIGVCALFSTVLATILQTRYQPRITPEKAALIFSLESVFASIFGYWLLGEVLTPRGLLGCAVIFCSIVGSEFMRAKQVHLATSS